MNECFYNVGGGMRQLLIMGCMNILKSMEAC